MPVNELWVWILNNNAMSRVLYSCSTTGGVNKNKPGRELGGRIYDEIPAQKNYIINFV